MNSKSHATLGSANHFLAFFRRVFIIKRLVFSINLRHFAVNYKIPLAMTAVLILLVSGLASVRLMERKSLIGLLPGISDNGQGYSTLLIADAPEEFKRGSTDSPEPSGSANTGDTSSGSSGSFSVNSGSSGSPPSSSGGGDGGGEQNSPPAAFSASIAYFRLASSTLDCTNPSKPNKGTCVKHYRFSGAVKTNNGPGNVNFSWRSNLQNANSGGSFSAPSGSNQRELQKTVTLECTKSSSYSMQLVLNSPVFTQSTTLNINHNCNEI